MVQLFFWVWGVQFWIKFVKIGPFWYLRTYKDLSNYLRLEWIHLWSFVMRPVWMSISEILKKKWCKMIDHQIVANSVMILVVVPTQQAFWNAIVNTKIICTQSLSHERHNFFRNSAQQSKQWQPMTKQMAHAGHLLLTRLQSPLLWPASPSSSSLLVVLPPLSPSSIAT